MNQQKYNGWTNYETWLVKLWLDNDQGSQQYWQEQAQSAFDGAEADETFTRKDNASFALRDQLKDWHEEIAFEQVGRNNGFVVDLLNASLSEVNWQEISASLIEDSVEIEIAP
jgi:hypothetical protein